MKAKVGDRIASQVLRITTAGAADRAQNIGTEMVELFEDDPIRPDDK